MSAARPRRGGVVRRGLFWAYVVLLAASSLVRWSTPAPPLPSDRLVQPVPAFRADGTRVADHTVEFAWLEWSAGELVYSAPAPTSPRASSEGPDAVPAILLHGSPGAASNFRAVGPLLSASRDIYAPDLPGFGASSRRIPDYSIEAHARYLLEWMDRQEIERAHLVGFSMGGGVALHMWEQAPERVASLVLLASIGVQEMELLGDYHLNHLLHAVQLAGIRAGKLLLPHFGALDHGMLDASYARNFYDTDQRPLRPLLERFEPPTLILHGARDPLVPKEAALEHARIVPQSELVMRPDSHFFIFQSGSGAAETLADFFARVDAGEAPTRSQATPQRIAAAQEPFRFDSVPPWGGLALLIVLVTIALATFVSEDLTLIGTGLLVAQQRVEYLPAASAAFVGIVVGDALLFWAGRAWGRRIVKRRPFSWWITPRAIRESSAWLRRRGAAVILITRVLPGTRLPTNVAAGILRTSAVRFITYFALAGVFWTFPVVWLVARLGEQFLPELEHWRWRLLWGLIVLGGVMWLVRMLVVPLLTWRGRRRLLGAWRRRTRWEFWPSWAIYLPLLPWFAWQGVRHRGMTVFTCANPSIPSGGFVGESKSQILSCLPEGVAPAWIAVPEVSSCSPQEREQLVRDFVQREQLDFPVVIKPDVGERGAGVHITSSWDEIRRALHSDPRLMIAQEFAPGREFSVFWMKQPSTDQGRIFSVTIKHRPQVTGDGRRTLFDLILADDRAVALASTYLEENPDAREWVPELGERVALTEVGAHSRGTVFEEGSHLITDELTAAIAEIASQFRPPQSSAPEGLDFGRFDVITSDQDSLRAGKDLRVLEVNGITSESTNMYDRRYNLLDAWRILRQQWAICFEIGAQRRDAGARPATGRELWRAWRNARGG